MLQGWILFIYFLLFCTCIYFRGVYLTKLVFCFLSHALSIFQTPPNDAACEFPLQFTTPPAELSKTPLMLPIHPILWLFAYSFGCLPSACGFPLQFTTPPLQRYLKLLWCFQSIPSTGYLHSTLVVYLQSPAYMWFSVICLNAKNRRLGLGKHWYKHEHSYKHEPGNIHSFFFVLQFCWYYCDNDIYWWARISASYDCCQFYFFFLFPFPVQHPCAGVYMHYIIL